MSAHGVVKRSGLVAICALLAAGCSSERVTHSTDATSSASGEGSSVDTVHPAVSSTIALTTDGDPIEGWSWLRDDGGVQSARWVFGRMPGGGTIEPGR